METTTSRKQEIEYLKASILEQRTWGNNKVADLLCEELKELQA